jgi:hypothetical protein
VDLQAALKSSVPLITIAVIAAVAAPAASGDILATVEVPGTGGANLDIATVNAGTGTRTAPPVGINTQNGELHPSLSSDGNRLVFQRVDPIAGTDRIIAYEFSTGASADLFDAFAAQQEQPATPLISADGTSVLTGRPLEHRDPSLPSGVLQPSLSRTSLSNFPAGPFPRSQENLPNNFALSGRTTQPIERGGILAVGITFNGLPPRGDIEVTGSTGTGVIGEQSAFVGHPALSSSLVVFERAPISGSSTTAADLVFRTSDPTSVAGAADVFLPNVIDSSLDESRPAFTSDDRYLGFIRHNADHDRLFVFDTQTQTMLNSSGVDLGALPSSGIGDRARRDGNLVLRQKLVLSKSSLSAAGLLSTSVLSPTGVGILVQRIVGHHKLLGKTVPKLRLVGRVPFGSHKAGRLRTRWDHKVGGRRLAPGRYLVTVRAVTRRGQVRELGRSFTVHIH